MGLSGPFFVVVFFRVYFYGEDKDEMKISYMTGYEIVHDSNLMGGCPRIHINIKYTILKLCRERRYNISGIIIYT